MSQDQLAIAIVVLGAWGARDGGYGSRLKPPPNSGGDGMLDTSGRSLMVVVLDEELLMNLALWWWVVFVLWATRPNYD